MTWDELIKEMTALAYKEKSDVCLQVNDHGIFELFKVDCWGATDITALGTGGTREELIQEAFELRRTWRGIK